MVKKLLAPFAILVLVMNFFVPADILAAEEVVYTLQLEEPELEGTELLGESFTKISMPGTFSIGERVGAPMIQTVPLKLLLPQGTEVEDIEITAGSVVEVDAAAKGFDLKDAQPIIPYQPPVPFGHAAPVRLEKNTEAYRSLRSFPQTNYSSAGVGYCRGYAIITLNVYPTQYIPGSGKLYYNPEITIRVKLKDTGHISEFYRPDNQSDREWVEALVDNPNMIQSYGGGIINRYEGGLCDPSHNGGLGYDYVIITREALFNFTAPYNWDDLIAQKQAEGLEATKVKIEDITACVDYHNPDPLFNDTPARIREFMKDAYEDWGAEYILVGGDQDGVNAVQRRLLSYAYEPNCESDLYWSNLDSNFNADHDNLWGEEGDTGFDLYSELFIGSIPCDIGMDVSNWLTKSFYYASNFNRDYLENAAFYGGNTGWTCEGDDFIDYSAIMGLDYWSGPQPEPYPSWLDFQYGFETWNEENPGLEYDMSVKWTAEPPNPGGWQGGSENAAITGLRNSINNDDVTLCSAIAHANAYMSMDVQYSIWESSYHNTMPFLVHDYGCHCGDMDAADDGVLHSMLFHSDTELAFACVYNSGYGWGNFSSTKSSSSLQQKSFWDYMFDRGNSGSPDFWQLGRAQAWSKDLMAPTINWDPGYGTWRGVIESCLLFGDPAQTIKPAVVGEYLAFSHPDGLPEIVNPDGGNTVRVQVSEDGAPGTGVFYYNIGAGWNQESMTQIEPNLYEAVFPASPCDDSVEYYFSAQHTNGETFYDPWNAPIRTYSVYSVYGFIMIFEDNFEEDLGWTVVNDCSDGEWERGIPIGGGDRGDPPTDYDGSGNCYLTDNEDGNSDVDSGYTWLSSPSLDLSAYDNPIIQYALWYTNNIGDNPNNDFFKTYISNDNGANWIEAQVFGPTSAAGWTVESFFVSDFVTPNDQIKVRFEASDLAGGSVVEAGIDAFKIFIPDCGGAVPNVSIDMIPDNPPVTVPAGGSFTFTGILENNTDQPQTTDVWIMLGLPGGSTYGPLQQFNNVTLSPYQTITVPGVTQYVPGYAPLGTYDYIAYCGDYPSGQDDFTSFEFTVTAPIAGGADNWNLTGWFKEIVDVVPLVTELYGNYPNPFNPTTSFSYSLARAGEVSLEVFNVLGQRVATVIDEHQKAGFKTVQWDASNYASGVYFYKLTAGDKVFTRRMTLLK